MVESKNQMLQEARAMMNYLTGDEEVRRLEELREKWAMDRYYDMETAREEGKIRGKREGLKEGKRQGLKKGKAEGEQNAKKKIAQELLRNGIDMKIIAKSTGLTQEEIQNLKSKQE